MSCFDGDYKQYEAPLASVFPVNPPNMDGVRDNTELMFLQDASLLHNIKVLLMSMAHFVDTIYEGRDLHIHCIHPDCRESLQASSTLQRRYYETGLFMHTAHV